jgi:hypothetical protein
MRLSDDKARRLTALVWRERARRWLPVLLVALALVGGLTFMLSSQVERADRTVAVHEREGTVLSIKQGGSRGVVPKGSHVIVAEARHASGRLTYDVVRLVDQ